jgi:hypothetical protein
MYLALLLNLFYMLCILIFIYIIGQYFFIWCFMKYVYLCDRCRTCTCRTCSEPMCHPFGNDASHINLWDAWFPNYPAYFRQPKNDDRCVLSSVCLCVSFVHDFGSLTLLFSDIPISDVWSENIRQFIDPTRRQLMGQLNYYSIFKLESRLLNMHDSIFFML